MKCNLSICSLAGQIILWERHALVPVFDADVLSTAPCAASHPAPAWTTWTVIVTTVVDVRLETCGTTIAISATRTTALPFLSAWHTSRFGPLIDIGALSELMVGARATVDIVLTGESAQIGALIQWNKRV